MTVLTTDLETAYGTLPVLHTTQDGVELTPDHRTCTVYFAETCPERIFYKEDACYDWYMEAGDNLSGTSNLVASQVFGEWLGDDDFSTKEVA